MEEEKREGKGGRKEMCSYTLEKLPVLSHNCN